MCLVTERIVAANNQKLLLVQWSDRGPAVLFLHLMLGDHSSWNTIRRRQLCLVRAVPSGGPAGVDCGARRYEAPACFPRILAPVLLLFGNPGQGSVVSAGRRAELRSLLAKVTVSEWEQAGHGLHDADPPRFAQELRQFLRQPPAAGCENG